MREVVSPLRRYATPRYPTAGEIGEADLSRVPERWKGLRTIVSTIGAVALGLKTLALGGEARDAPASAPTENVPDAKKPQRESPRPVTDVCPLPPASLAGDGEGAFGCVAMNPPVILSEDAALAIIEREFRRRGVTLADAQELDGVEAPLGERERKRANPNLVARLVRARRAPLEEPLKKRTWIFDFGTRDGSMRIEYISVSDAGRWLKDPWEGSTVRTYRTRDAAEAAVQGFGKRTEGNHVDVGVFYDPIAYVPKQEIEAFEKDAGGKPDWKKKYEFEKRSGRKIAERQLVAQIEWFFSHLSKRHAPDAPSH